MFTLGDIGKPIRHEEIEPIRALRKFRLNDNGSLRSLYFEHVWSAEKNIAICRRGENSYKPYYQDGLADDHSMTECDHGFWAYNAKGDIDRYDYTVTGIIDAYGEVIIGEKGVRAMKADLIAIYLPPVVPESPHVKIIDIEKSDDVGEEMDYITALKKRLILSPHLRRGFASLYPNLPVYSSVKEMLNDYPITLPPT